MLTYADIEPTLASFDHARPLPRAAYSDPEVFALELQRIFAVAWHVVVDASIYWFNDMDYHGVLADPFFRYSIRVDGVFDAEFRRRLEAHAREVSEVTKPRRRAT